eukprot:SAG31_NODE_18790_length_622_cov_1.527725_1_plen_74_part_10
MRGGGSWYLPCLFGAAIELWSDPRCISLLQLVALLVALATCTPNPLGLISLAKATPTPHCVCESVEVEAAGASA